MNRGFEKEFLSNIAVNSLKSLIFQLYVDISAVKSEEINNFWKICKKFLTLCMVIITLCLVCFTRIKANFRWKRTNIMIRQQKIALTVLIVSLLGLFLGITITLMKHYVPGFPKGTVAFGGFILSLGVFLFISRLLKKNKGEVVSDERDMLIEKNAYLAGFGAVYLLVILVSYLPMAIAPEAKIPAKWFPFLLPIAVLCQCFVMSLATLIQYGRGGKGNE